VVQSWDTALTAEPTSDFSVGLTFGFHDGCWHLLDLERQRLDFPDLKRRVQGLAARWNADVVVVEHAGSGISLLQQLRQEERNRARLFVDWPVRLDKRTRLEAQTPRLESGRYKLPREAPWLEAFRRELLAFPNGRYDDQVDSLVLFLEWSSCPRALDFPRRDPVTGRPRRRSRNHFG
jgi:predicted phage terminase large subunit-like protein